MQNDKSSNQQTFPIFHVNQANRLKNILRIRAQNNKKGKSLGIVECSKILNDPLSKLSESSIEKICMKIDNIRKESPLKVCSLSSQRRVKEKEEMVRNLQMNENRRQTEYDERTKYSNNHLNPKRIIKTCDSFESDVLKSFLLIDQSKVYSNKQDFEVNEDVLKKRMKIRTLKRIHSSQQLTRPIEKSAFYEFFLQERAPRVTKKMKTKDFLLVKKFTPNIVFIHNVQKKRTRNCEREKEFEIENNGQTPEKSYLKNLNSKAKSNILQRVMKQKGEQRPKIILFRKPLAITKTEQSPEKDDSEKDFRNQLSHRISNEYRLINEKRLKEKEVEKEREDAKNRKMKSNIKRLQSSFTNISCEEDDHDLKQYLKSRKRITTIL